jgi:hypothetical protein
MENSITEKMTQDELDQVCKEISENLFPENVFSDEQLKAWALRCKTPLDLFPLKDLKNDIEEAKM